LRRGEARRGRQRVRRAGRLLVGAGAAALVWGHFEAGWIRFRTRRVAIPRLPRRLGGLRIAHLSDFHLGVPSRGNRAVERAVAWAAAGSFDIVVVTGDLLSRPGGERGLRALAAQLPDSFVVLGNHDYAVSRDPFVRASGVTELAPAVVLADDSRTIGVRGCRVQIVGIDPRSYLDGRAVPEHLVDGGADLRILLCHFPKVLDRLIPGHFDLVLAGDVHDGQISLPFPGGKLRLGHPAYPYPCGVYQHDAAVLHVSPGLGTTFVPFRFFARPEATELVLVPGE
jgi:uncharacterized protein